MGTLSQKGFAPVAAASLMCEAATLGSKLSHYQDINAADSHKHP